MATSETLTKPVEGVDPLVLELGAANGWLRTSKEGVRRPGPKPLPQGVSAYADHVEFVPDVKRTARQRRALAKKLYGEPRDPGPLLHDE